MPAWTIEYEGDAFARFLASLPPYEQAVLIRVFCTFYGKRIVLLYGGYDKKRDPSVRRQQREMANARKAHARWKSQRRR